MGAGGSAAALGVSTAAAWGAADFSGGLATKRGAPTLVVAVSHGFSLILLLVIAPFLHARSTPGYALYGALSGVFCSVGLIALYSALSQGAMGLNSAVSGVLTPIVPVLVSWYKESHASPQRLIGFAVAVVAIWLVAYTPGRGSSGRPRGLGLAVFSGLSFGVMLVFMHLAAARGVIHALIAMRLASAPVAALAGIALWLSRGRVWPARSDLPDGKLFRLAIFAGLLDTSGNLLYLFASRTGRLDVTAVLASLYPATTILLAAWLLKERATRSQAAGMVLALVAVVLIST